MYWLCSNCLTSWNRVSLGKLTVKYSDVSEEHTIHVLRVAIGSSGSKSDTEEGMHISYREGLERV
jgi:hypothetical protein